MYSPTSETGTIHAPVYVVANTKGGSGKTTTTVNMAVARAMTGLNILAVNGDKQKTLNIALRNRATAEVQPTLSCVHYPDGPELRTQVMHQAKLYDEVWIDCGGEDSPSMRAAFMLADTILIPFQPRSFDVWAMEDVLELLVDVKSMRDAPRMFAFLNCADPGDSASDNVEAAAYVKALNESLGLDVELLDTPLRRRKSFSNGCGLGLSVLEPLPKDMKKPLDKKAINELNNLLVALIGESARVKPAAGLALEDHVAEDYTGVPGAMPVDEVPSPEGA